MVKTSPGLVDVELSWGWVVGVGFGGCWWWVLSCWLGWG